MGDALSIAINLIGEMDVGLRNKREILSLLQNKGIPAKDANKAYKLGLRNNLRTSLSISDALQTLLTIPRMTPAEAGEILISRGLNAEAVHQALQSVDIDPLDSIDEHANSLISPYAQDAEGTFVANQNKISDIDPNILLSLVDFISKNPQSDDMQIEKFLEAHKINSSEIRAIIRMIHLADEHFGEKTAAQTSFEPNMYTDDLEISANDLASILIRDQNMEPDQALNALVQTGIPEDEATRAIRSVREEKYEDKYDRPQGDLGSIMGEGQTEEGPVEMPPVDAGGDPMPNPSGHATTGEDIEMGMSPTDSTAPMEQLTQETNPAEGNQIRQQDTRDGELDWKGRVEGLLRENPNMNKNEIGAILTQEGAPQSTVRDILMRQFESQDSGDNIQPNSSVSYKGKNYKVAGTTSTLYGDMIVLSNGVQIMADDENLGSPIKEKKEASVSTSFNKLIKKSDNFFKKEYRYEEKSLQKMAKRGNELIEEFRNYEPEKMSELVGVRSKISLLQTAVKEFEKASKKQSKENQEYLENQPTYHVGTVFEGHEFGPGGGEAISIVASEMKKEHEELIESWPKTAATIASQLIENNTEYISSTGDIRRVASRFIDAKFAHVDGETRDFVRSGFLNLVEKARRIAVHDITNKKEAKVSTDKLPHNYDEGVFF